MKKKISEFAYTTLLLLVLGISSCSSNDDEIKPIIPETKGLDLTQFDTGKGVLMQAFYWDVTPKGSWYAVLSDKIEDWKTTGVDRIWLAPPSKGQSGINSMGYDPSDYFDLGEYNQHNTNKTRFGSKTELIELITKAHNNQIEVIADIVLNHNSGGSAELNPYRNKNTYTLFNELNGNSSGMFNRGFEDYHPNSIHNNDEEALFFEEQDVCHHQTHVQDWFWKNDNSVAKYYKNTIGFDGWRFDYVKGFGPWVVKAWNDEVGGFSVGEYWDGYAPNIAEWVEASGSSAFDFACFYKLEEAFDRNNDLTYLNNDMLRKTHPDKAVTFVSNHDTEKDNNPDNRIDNANKMKAYAYIMTHSGYPTVFYKDYESSFKEELKNLILIQRTIASGSEDILNVDQDEYIMRRNGVGNNPGLILYINTSNQAKEKNITTNWKSKTLYDYSTHINEIPNTDATGNVTLKVPANSYSIWSIN